MKKTDAFSCYRNSILLRVISPIFSLSGQGQIFETKCIRTKLLNHFKCL